MNASSVFSHTLRHDNILNDIVFAPSRSIASSMFLSTRSIVTCGLVLCAYVAFRAAKAALSRYLLHKLTAMGDLEGLARPRGASPLSGTAVVCGGSFAGLFTARICATHFEKVVVVEPEAWTFTGNAQEPLQHSTRPVDDHTNGRYLMLAHKRARVYQYASIHLFQVILTKFLRTAFPAFDSAAKAFGVRFAPNDQRISIGGRPLVVPFNSPTVSGYGNEGIFCTRRTLEALVRRLVHTTCPNVEFVNGTISDYILADDYSSVRSVVVRTGESETSEITCSLVADCTGNSQVGYKVLNRVVPKLKLRRDDYNPDFRLCSLEFPIPPNFDEDLAKLGIPGITTVEEAKAATWLLTGGPDVEIDYHTVVAGKADDRVCIAAGGYSSDLPITLDAVREYAAAAIGAPGVKKPVPDWYFGLLDLLEPVADEATVFMAKCISSSKVYYEQAADRLPRNFVAVGDSTLRLNPRAGEGISKCTIGALTLDGVLRERGPEDSHFGSTYFERLEGRTSHLWLAAKLSDYGMSTTTPVRGESLEQGALVRTAMNSLNNVIVRDTTKFWRSDRETATAFWQTLNFIRPPTDLMTPRMFFRLGCELFYSKWVATDAVHY